QPVDHLPRGVCLDGVAHPRQRQVLAQLALGLLDDAQIPPRDRRLAVPCREAPLGTVGQRTNSPHTRRGYTRGATPSAPRHTFGRHKGLVPYASEVILEWGFLRPSSRE